MTKTKMLKTTLIIAAALGAAAVAVVLVNRNSARMVTLISPERGLAVEAVYATGTVEPENWAQIAAVTTGRIAEILVREGDRVTRGQPLAQLDDREAQARVVEQQARAAYWREELKRAQTLANSGIRARQSAEQAQSEYDQAAAAIAAARQRSADLVVRAPMNGVVLRRDGEAGEVVKPETTLFWIGETRPLRITADVDEEDIAQVSAGQKVLIKADAFPDQSLNGHVGRITPKGDPINKTFRVRISLPDDTPLMIGMTTEINIVTAEKPDASLIPASAVGDGRVWIADEHGRAVSRPVVLGIKGRDKVEVLSGLGPDDRVIASPPSGLAAGARLRVP